MAAQSILYEDDVPMKASEYSGFSYPDLLIKLKERLVEQQADVQPSNRPTKKKIELCSSDDEDGAPKEPNGPRDLNAPPLPSAPAIDA